jgi:protein-tyrosine phosphatase
MDRKSVLFLCTGNYYRSRFAEELFNHLAARQAPAWRATSRALAIERGAHCNFGPVSKHVAAALVARGLGLADEQRYPMPVQASDFLDADLVIALKEAEHRPLMEQRFPAWSQRIEYWHVHDLDQAAAAEALTEIEALVRQLLVRLQTPGGPPQQ